MKINSIRRMLLLSVNAVILLMLLITSLNTWFNVHHEIDELFDAQLAQYARLIRHLMVEPNTPLTADSNHAIEMPFLLDDGVEHTAAAERYSEGHKYESKIAVQVWHENGQLLIRSGNVGKTPLLPKQSGFHEIRHNQYLWIGFSLYVPDEKAWIFTAQREDVRDELSWHLTLNQLLPLGIAILPIMLLVWLAVEWGTKPVRELSEKLAETNPTELQPIEMPLPRELKPFKDAVNKLMAELKAYLKKEKMFIANVSHELRTPLSILQVHTDNLENATDIKEQHTAIQAIGKSTRRLAHLVKQLMETEKLEHSIVLQYQAIQLLRLTEDALASIDFQLIDRVIWVVDIPKQLQVRVDPALFQAALRNLLDNAAKYAPAQSEVSIKARIEQHAVVISVSNAINGDITLELARLGERFFRSYGHQDVAGAGLGLSITRKIVNLHGGKLVFSQDITGRFVTELFLPQTT